MLVRNSEWDFILFHTLNIKYNNLAYGYTVEIKILMFSVTLHYNTCKWECPGILPTGTKNPTCKLTVMLTHVCSCNYYFKCTGLSPIHLKVNGLHNNEEPVQS